MMKFNKEQIIRALECCYTAGISCHLCPLYELDHCNDTLMANYVRNLIKELTDENERLKTEPRKIVEQDFLALCVKELLNTETSKVAKLIQEAIVRKFVKYLKEQSFSCDPGNGFSFDAIDVDELDNYVQEFLEEYK